MAIYAHIDAAGRALAFYDSVLHAGRVPPDAVEIPEATWLNWLANPETRRWQGGGLVACDPPAVAMTAAGARRRRGALLAACDWTQVADAPLAPGRVAEWAAYRQALRDVTAQAGFPEAIDWPQAPG